MCAARSLDSSASAQGARQIAASLELCERCAHYTPPLSEAAVPSCALAPKSDGTGFFACHLERVDPLTCGPEARRFEEASSSKRVLLFSPARCHSGGG
jgi:hypothetical protein